MCKPNENTGGDRHYHVIISYLNFKNEIQTYTSHPFIELATAKKWWANFKDRWPSDAGVTYIRDDGIVSAPTVPAEQVDDVVAAD